MTPNGRISPRRMFANPLAPVRCSRFRWFMIFGLMLSLVEMAAAQGAQKLPGGLTLTETTLAPNTWVHGMVERRFVIDNPTPHKQTVHLNLPASSFIGGGMASLSQSLPANAGMRTVAILPQPAMTRHGMGNRMSARVGRHPPENVTCRPLYPVSKKYYSTVPIGLLVSKSFSAEKLKERLVSLATESPSRHDYLRGDEVSKLSREDLTDRLVHRRFMESLNPMRFEGEAEAWPRHWLAFSPFDGCVIAATDYERMPEASRQALRDFAALGGQVTLMGMATPPKDWRAWPDTPANKPHGESHPWFEMRYGFGRLCLLSGSDVETLPDSALARLPMAWARAAQPWLAPHDDTTANLEAIPVADNVRVPARTFLVVLLLFTLLAGPGAVLFTRRKNRRIWLLALVPAFSLLFSLAILVYSLLSEGITPSLRRQAVTLLDQGNRCAVTLGAVGVYAPVSPRDGLHFDSGTEVSPLSDVRSGRIRVGSDQHYVSGWLQPRMPAFFRLRRAEHRAERLLVDERESGQIEVVNALGAPISWLRVRDRRGRLFETRDLAPGEKRGLADPLPRPSGARTAFEALGGTQKRCPDAGWNIQALADDLANGRGAPVEPAPGRYVAVLDGAPFLEDPLAYARTRNSARSIVLGWHGEE